MVTILIPSQPFSPREIDEDIEGAGGLGSRHLKGAWSKWRRGNLHAESFNEQARAFLEEKPYAVSVEAEPERGKYVYRISVRQDFPSETLEPILGDAVHNYRSALDHVAWQLAVANDPSHRSSLNDRFTSFPIFTDGKQYRTLGRGRTKRMGVQAQALIEQMQPYQGPDPERHVASVLQELDNGDKHKGILLAMAAVEEFKYSKGVHTKGLKMAVSGEAIYHGMQVMEITLGVPDLDFDPNVEPSFNVILCNAPISGRH